ncbi:hypothetical protein CC2G_011160 [Coprinopsis cinerea AmutBmut pab1-1]|nr:hypothetical protein CC2G_011160 [Coprinopsis cinerea AmutBmut pab1-1]
MTISSSSYHIIDSTLSARFLFHRTLGASSRFHGIISFFYSPFSYSPSSRSIMNFFSFLQCIISLQAVPAPSLFPPFLIPTNPAPRCFAPSFQSFSQSVSQPTVRRPLSIIHPLASSILSSIIHSSLSSSHF